MKWKEWVILAMLIAGVAALELFGPGDMSVEQDSSPAEHTLTGRSTQSLAPRSAEGTALPGTGTDPIELFRTVRVHVTGTTQPGPPSMP